MNIDQFIKQLDNEIHETIKESDQAAALDRLKMIAETYAGEDRVVSSHDIAKEMKERPVEEKIMTGFSGVDAILDGFRKKQVITLAAPTKSGKTSFCVDVTTHIREYNPLWFALEESPEELLQKFIDRGEELPFFYTPQQNKTNDMEWLESKIVEGIAKFNTQVVFIDNLDFIVPFISTADHYHLQADVMRNLKGIAKRWNIVVVLIAHMKKVELYRQPDLDALKGSASIAQESDTVILLWREHRREDGQVVITDNVNVSVQANRRTGRTGNVKFVFHNGKFLEQEWKSYEEVKSSASREFAKY